MSRYLDLKLKYQANSIFFDLQTQVTRIEKKSFSHFLASEMENQKPPFGIHFLKIQTQSNLGDQVPFLGIELWVPFIYIFFNISRLLLISTSSIYLNVINLNHMSSFSFTQSTYINNIKIMSFENNLMFLIVREII